jgi:hypothetical protein
MARVTKSQPATDRGTNQGVYLHLFTNLFAFAFKLQTRIYLRIYLSIHLLAGHGPGYKIRMYTSSRMGTHAGGNTPVSIARSRTGAAVLVSCGVDQYRDLLYSGRHSFFRANRARFGSAAGRNKVGVRPLVGVRIARTIRRGVLLEFFCTGRVSNAIPAGVSFSLRGREGGQSFCLYVTVGCPFTIMLRVFNLPRRLAGRRTKCIPPNEAVRRSMQQNTAPLLGAGARLPYAGARQPSQYSLSLDNPVTVPRMIVGSSNQNLLLSNHPKLVVQQPPQTLVARQPTKSLLSNQPKNLLLCNQTLDALKSTIHITARGFLVVRPMNPIS